jgi:topoisomerase (DNA) II binding protein 1
MDVPATRPEVTTTGIYGEELAQTRQRLLRSDLSWCCDLTARTQVLIVGRVTPVGSRKLAVARARRLPCVSASWLTDGACSLDVVDAFDICSELSGKEVCTTSLSHAERSRVQAVCATRGAKYNPLLTRECYVLVVPAAPLAFTSPSASSPVIINDKIRFARKHGIWAITTDEFSLRYGVASPPREGVSSASYGGDAVAVVKDERPLPMRKGSSGVSEGSGPTCTDVSAEGKGAVGCGDASYPPLLEGIMGVHDGVTSLAVRGTAFSMRPITATPRPSTATASAPDPLNRGALSHTLNAGDSWRTSSGVVLSAVQPTLPSQLTAIAATGVPVTPTQLSRSLGDEFSDVVAYCSPPHSLTTVQHDLLTAMGVAITPQVSPFTTHVLVLGDAVEECLFPRPGLQIVSWQWVTQSQLEQRRLSCASFRVPLTFCPVVTFTGLSASDKQEIVTALQRSGLPCEVQGALVLGGGTGPSSRRDSKDIQRTLPSSSLSLPSFLPRPTTHLVSLRRQLLASQKVAVLAQHCRQHARRYPCSSVVSSLSSCRLVSVEWVYRSIQHGQWLDPELFALSLPHPEAFALAAAQKARSAEGGPAASSLYFQRSQSRAVMHLPIEIGSTVVPPVQRCQSTPSSPSPSLASGGAGGAVVQGSSTLVPSPSSVALHYPGCSPLRVAEEVVVMVGLVDGDGDGDDGCGAALSQKNTTAHDAEGTPHGSPLPLSTPPSAHMPACVGQHNTAVDADDDEAGGESPAATAALRSALQAIHTSQPPPTTSARPSQAEEQFSPSSPSKHSNDKSASPLKTYFAVTSHTCLGTQYSPTFENLLGELEAYPSGALGGGLPFAALGAPAQRPPSTTLTLAEQVSTDASLPAPEAESVLSSPPTSAGRQGRSQKVLQRASLHRQRIPQRRQPPSFLAGRSLSDESQVVFYQMGLCDQTAVAGALLGSTPPTSPQFAVDVLPGSSVTTAAASSATATVTAACDGVGNPASPSTTYTAVFLITKDVLKGVNFNWDAFAAQFPRFQRTSKPEECTHFITAKPSKTEQFLCCLAAGRWILTAAYLSACMASGHLVKEDAFEWSAEVAAGLGCRSSVASLVRGCRVQRVATDLPFAQWRVQVCCTSAARADSFLRVLRNGGCRSLQAVTPEEVLAAARANVQPAQVDDGAVEEKNHMVLADDTVFTEEELEQYAACATASRLGPIVRLDYLVQYLCAPGTQPSEMDLLHCVRSRKRSRTEPSSAHA